MFKATGPLLNPAIALGLQLTSFKFDHILQYIALPIGGGIAGFVFYELILRKTMDMLDDNGFGEI